jgi:hypothetical protein
VHPQAIGRCFVALLVSKFEKELGFYPNKKHEQFVINVILHVMEILNNFMPFPMDDGGYAIIAYLTHEHLNYKVYNLESKWAYYECL